MAFGEHFRIDENYGGSNFKAGEWDCTIVKAEEKTSQSGNEMVVLDFDIPEQGQLKYYLVDDKSSEEAWIRTNQNITRFFDCFNIQRGNFRISSWIGARGKIAIDKGEPTSSGKQYFEVKRLIVENNKQPQNNQGYGRQNTPPQNGYGSRPVQNAESAYVPQNQRGQRNNGQGNPYNQSPVNNGLDNIPF